MIERLPIRTNCRYGCHNFTEFELVKNRSFACCIETHHQNAHFFLSPKLIKQLRECETHTEGVQRDVGGEVGYPRKGFDKGLLTDKPRPSSHKIDAEDRFEATRGGKRDQKRTESQAQYQGTVKRLLDSDEIFQWQDNVDVENLTFETWAG